LPRRAAVRAVIAQLPVIGANAAQTFKTHLFLVKYAIAVVCHVAVAAGRRGVVRAGIAWHPALGANPVETLQAYPVFAKNAVLIIVVPAVVA